MLKCGLLGRKLGHSWSPAIHSMLADYEYKLYEQEPESVGKFLADSGLHGLNVTIPYKKTVMAHCSALSPLAREIGSVNTIVRRPDGTLYGDNTDAYGFESMLHQGGIDPSGQKCLVLGSGGASVTAQAVLKKMGAAKVIVISRSGEDNYTNLGRHNDAGVIVNTTPVGMYPDNGAAPLDLAPFTQLCGVADVVYNPMRTALLLQAEALGLPHIGGLHMLVAQAKRAAELFTGIAIPDGRISEIEKKLADDMMNIVLIGMPGCGKTTVSQALSQALGRPVYDSDALIVQRTGMPVTEYFTRYGEEEFRRRETEVLSDLGKKSGIIIATGGGCVTRGENYALLHQNGSIIRLERDLGQLSIDGRPLSLKGSLTEMYARRRPMYDRFADHTVHNNGTVENTVQQITEVLK